MKKLKISKKVNYKVNNLFLVKYILSLVMCAVIFISPLDVNVSAATNPYPKSQTINGVTTIPCTWYAWQQAYDNLGVVMPNFGNAKNWYANAKKNNYPVGSTAKPNSIAVWTNSGYGHVGYVVSVSGTTMKVSEGGMTDLNGNGILKGSICNSTVGSKKSSYSSSLLVGFIYVGDKAHIHNYGRFYEGDHPHRVYMKCSCGDWYYTGETAAAKGAYAWYAQVHPHYNHYYCTICGKPYRDENEPNVISDCEVCNPKINIIYGDINDDGNITTVDLGVLLQHINKWDVTIKTDSADVNDDGAINTQDYGILMQYVNGWNVSLG